MTQVRHRNIQPWSAEGMTLPNGQLASKFVIGDDDDPQAAVVFIVRWPPGCHVDVHTHESTYCEFVIEGSQKVGAKWFHAGDVRIAKGRQMYGPLIAGDEGCTIAIVFSDGRWEPIPLKPQSLEGMEEGVVDILSGISGSESASG